jgi:hypothetical protein
MTDLLSIPAFASRTEIHVVVESPRQAQAKFKYDPRLGAFMLSRALALGLSYPYDWGSCHRRSRRMEILSTPWCYTTLRPAQVQSCAANQ